jgi:restriction endonuclease S subunit
MREEMTTLGESCQFFNGKAHEKDIDAEGQFVVVNSKFISTDGEVKKFTAKQMFPLVENDIVMVMSDVPNGKALAKCYVIEENDKYSLNQRICAIRTTEFNNRFLYYQLNRHPYLLAFNNGENQTNLRKGDILDCPLWKPALEVQEQIVKILDEALDQIEQAQFNIEQNISNARELFQSKLNDIFSQKGDGWEERIWNDVLEIRSGRNQKEVLNPNGKYPILGSAGKIMGYADDFICEENTTIVGRKGTINNPKLIEEKFWNVDTAFGLHAKEGLDKIYLFYFCRSFNFEEMDRGSGRPSLVKSDLLKIKMPVPSIHSQKKYCEAIRNITK